MPPPLRATSRDGDEINYENAPSIDYRVIQITDGGQQHSTQRTIYYLENPLSVTGGIEVKNIRPHNFI